MQMRSKSLEILIKSFGKLLFFLFLIFFAQTLKSSEKDIYTLALKKIVENYGIDSLLLLNNTVCINKYISKEIDSITKSKVQKQFEDVDFCDTNSIVDIKSLLQYQSANIIWIDNELYALIMDDTTKRIHEKWDSLYKIYPRNNLVVFSTINYNSKHNLALIFAITLEYGNGSGDLLLFKKSKNKWKYFRKITCFKA